MYKKLSDCETWAVISSCGAVVLCFGLGLTLKHFLP